eukprot:464897-Pelagomonas_calceolata.AAC.12
METAGCIHPRECEAAPTTNNLARLPFDLLVEVAARVSAPKDISSLLQASRVTSSLKSSPQLLSRWLLTHRKLSRLNMVTCKLGCKVHLASAQLLTNLEEKTFPLNPALQRI